MTLTDMLVPSYTQMLRALDNWLAKAAEHGSGDAVMAARLAPDMFPLATQIRFACVQVQEGLYRLRGEAFPPSVAALLDEGRLGGERPGTITDARARIAETLALVERIGSDMPAIEADAPIAHALPQGLVFDLSAQQFVRDWALPQFYFHVMTAYAILRAHGVALGKVDYVAHMFAYLRPDTAPGA